MTANPRQTLALLAALLTFGCGDDVRPSPDSSVRDGAADSQQQQDSAADGKVADARVIDADRQRDSMTDASIGDARADASSVQDASTDASTDGATANLGRVTCRATQDCNPSQTCNRAAPGGVCLGCVDETDCPDIANMGCFGATACFWKCGNDNDCNAGKRCDGLGRCVIRTCRVGMEECPQPYACSKSNGDPGLCERPSCVNNTCPAPLVCQANRCVEP